MAALPDEKGEVMLIEDVELFLAMAESSSMSQAADRLFMSRQGLSQRVSSIESRLGAKLYNRSSSGIELTPAGELVTKFAQSVAVLNKKLDTELSALDEHFDATLRIGMSLADGQELLPALVRDFRVEHPSSRIVLKAGYEPDLINSLRQGDLDLAILENQPLESGIEKVTLGYKKLVFLAPDRSPYNKEIQPVRVSKLLEWPAVTYEWNSGYHLTGNKAFRERYNITLWDHNMPVQFGTHEARIAGVRAGIGWGSFPECVAAKHMNELGVLPIDVDTDPIWYPVDLAWASDRPLSDEARDFAAFVQANVPEGYFRRKADPNLPAL